jgi:hypothetical protein
VALDRRESLASRPGHFIPGQSVSRVLRRGSWMGPRTREEKMLLLLPGTEARFVCCTVGSLVLHRLRHPFKNQYLFYAESSLTKLTRQESNVSRMNMSEKAEI